MENNQTTRADHAPLMLLFIEQIERNDAIPGQTYAGVTGTTKNDYTDDK